ncbi:mechanosensitive ion channel family protein [Sphingomonas immobilis]|uniref:Mechanosensitive ion channel family protein n=1 Tax=Sphingomonas immobilis TaxID=3063997 RepID=A0ABT8ZY49_9SPHN|nr:mechanosensitive ion channel family protein [Sphingomonas sp. CA1-15]MDO7842484.1 mechanosensitive ion channel family protein [Sphingomonas sp. CA1-15]
MTNTAAPKTPNLGADQLRKQIVDLWNASMSWLQAHWLQILIAVGAGVAIYLALHALKVLGRRLCTRDPSGKGWPTIFGRAIGKTGNFFIAMVAAKLVGGYANPPEQVLTTINFLFTIATVFQAAVWAREIILGAIEHRTSLDSDHGQTLANAMGLIQVFVTFAVFAIALIVVLQNLGVNVSGLIAGLGVGGIAIALAAQGIFADLFAALTIIFDRPFRRGDAITFDKSSGTVEQVGMKSVRIRGTNGEERIISNKNLLDKEIINNTQREFRRVIFTLGLVQTTPVEVMEKLPAMLKEVVEEHGAKFVRAGFTAYGAQSYDFELQFDSVSAVYQDMYDARHTVGLGIVRRLNDEGIALAYPTQTGLSAEEAGLIQPAPPPKAPPGDKIDKPVSSGDRSTADQ